MTYVKTKELSRYLRSNNLKVVGVIDASGSVRGMNKHFGWSRYTKIRSGNSIYAVN